MRTSLFACCEASICSPFVCKQDAARIASASGFCVNRQSSIRTFLLTSSGGISLKRNGSFGRSKRGDSQNICSERTTPARAGALTISRESTGGDQTAKDGRNHSARARKNGTTLECERHPFDFAQDRLKREESERFKSFAYEELTKHDKHFTF